MSMSLNDIMTQGQDSLFIDNGKSQLVVNAKQGEALTLEDILPAGEDASSAAGDRYRHRRRHRV